MTTLPATIGPVATNGGRGAHCSKCNRPVDLFAVRTPAHIPPVSVWETPPPYPQMKYTGEVIVLVECHGERWAWSNWHGELPPEMAALEAERAPRPRW